MENMYAPHDIAMPGNLTFGTYRKPVRDMPELRAGQKAKRQDLFRIFLLPFRDLGRRKTAFGQEDFAKLIYIYLSVSPLHGTDSLIHTARAIIVPAFSIKRNIVTKRKIRTYRPTYAAAEQAEYQLYPYIILSLGGNLLILQKQ